MESRVMTNAELQKAFANYPLKTITLKGFDDKHKEINITPDALEHFGAAFLDRVKIKIKHHGEWSFATIVGATIKKNEKKLWLLIDEETRIFHCREIQSSSDLIQFTKKLNANNCPNKYNYAHGLLQDYVSKLAHQTSSPSKLSKAKKLLSLLFHKPSPVILPKMVEDDETQTLIVKKKKK